MSEKIVSITGAPTGHRERVKRVIHKLSGLRATITAKLVPLVKQIVVDKIGKNELPQTEEAFIVGIATATIGSELEKMGDGIVASIDTQVVEVGRCRRLIEHALDRVLELLKHHQPGLKLA